MTPTAQSRHRLLPALALSVGLLTSCSVAVSFDEYNDETWQVHGTVSGLDGAMLVFFVNDERFEVGDGPFTSKRLADGSAYLLTIEAQPKGRRCTIAGGEGKIDGADVTGVEVKCTAVAR